jgi:hypothetical protein
MRLLPLVSQTKRWADEPPKGGCSTPDSRDRHVYAGIRVFCGWLGRGSQFRAIQSVRSTKLGELAPKKASSLPPLVQLRLSRLEDNHLACRLRKPKLEGDHQAVTPFVKISHGEEGWWEKTCPRRAGRTGEYAVAPRVR